MAASLEIGGEKCGGLGMEDLESMLSVSVASPPGDEQSFFQWFDMDGSGASMKQLLLSGCGSSAEFNGGASGFGPADLGFGFESVSTPANANAVNPPLAAADFPLSSNRLLSLPNPITFPNFRGSCFGSGNNSSSTPPNPISSPSAGNLLLPLSTPPGACYHHQQQQFEPIDEKPQLFNTQHLINQQQAQPPQQPSFFLPLSYAQQELQHLLLPPQLKRHRPNIVDPSCPILKAPFSDSSNELFVRLQQQQQQQQQQQSFPNLHLLPQQLQQRPAEPKLECSSGDGTNQQQQLQASINQLFKAAELVEAGNSVLARGILARLNQQLSPIGKPLLRAAFYFKEALQLLLNTTATAPSSPLLSTPAASPLDAVFKISAYKAFSEISPVLQFAHFTSNQAFLEALDGNDHIHIIDFDIGLGGQWASFMQELALRLSGTPSLKITAFASPSSHDPLEFSLTRENLSHFARDLGIPFEFNFINLESVDLPVILSPSGHEAVAVSFPIDRSTNLSAPLLLRLVKQLAPKIILAVDHGGDRSELPFSCHFLHALQSYAALLESLDAANVNSNAVQKIERHLLRPRIENTVLGRHRAGDKMQPWRPLFASTGFSPVPFSNFTESQAECLVKRVQLKGFHVEKRQASLCLCWQHRELVSVSAWRC